MLRGRGRRSFAVRSGDAGGRGGGQGNGACPQARWCSSRGSMGAPLPYASRRAFGRRRSRDHHILCRPRRKRGLQPGSRSPPTGRAARGQAGTRRSGRAGKRRTGRRQAGARKSGHAKRAWSTGPSVLHALAVTLLPPDGARLARQDIRVAGRGMGEGLGPQRGNCSQDSLPSGQKGNPGTFTTALASPAAAVPTRCRPHRPAPSSRSARPPLIRAFCGAGSAPRNSTYRQIPGAAWSLSPRAGRGPLPRRACRTRRRRRGSGRGSSRSRRRG